MTAAPLIAHVVGARPNYMKVAPVYQALAARGLTRQLLIHTGQHYDPALRDVFFDELPLPVPDLDLGVGSGMHGEQTGRALIALERAFVEHAPDAVVVPGDVNSTLAGALAAVKLGIPLCHLEAGLRSFDWEMPEEHNRRVADHLSTLLLTHSKSAGANLEREGIPADRVEFVGNTMVDSLLRALPAARALRAWAAHGLEEKRYVLVTLHRPALVDDRDLLRETMEALGAVARALPVIFPAHPRTRRRLVECQIELEPGVLVVEPLPYGVFLSLELAAAAVITDSGGVQEETTALGVPCFTLRANTERPVTLTHGSNRLLGLSPAEVRRVPDLLDDPMPVRMPPRWDGHAGERAAAAIELLVSAPAAEPSPAARS